MPIGLTTRWPESDHEATPVFGRNAQIAVMSGRRPVVKGCFEAAVNVSGAVMLYGLLMR